MIIGAMNHPREDPVREIRWMSEMGLDFIDLTLEPPGAASWTVNPREIRAALRDYALGVVGHTPYYLPIGSPFESLRRASLDELKKCLEQFSEIGARWMNVHPDRYAPMHDRAFSIERDLLSLQELVEHGNQFGVGIMVENLPGSFNTVSQLSELLDPLRDLGLHLDIGHSNLLVDFNTAGDLIQAYGARIKHVHLHDNKGGAEDLHLPLGAGSLEVSRYVGALKKSGYDDTITLEVFTHDRHYLRYSRDVLKALWESL
jgi:sugar phosphate isomerase/epimerase